MTPRQFEKITQSFGAYCCILIQDLQSPILSLKMDAEMSSETSVNIYQPTHRHIQDYWILHKNCCWADITLKNFVTRCQKRNLVTYKMPCMLNKRPIKSHVYVQRKRTRVFHNITWLQGGRSRKCGSIPVGGKKCNLLKPSGFLTYC
jgi:hypothetical protein